MKVGGQWGWGLQASLVGILPLQLLLEQGPVSVSVTWGHGSGLVSCESLNTAPGVCDGHGVLAAS